MVTGKAYSRMFLEAAQTGSSKRMSGKGSTRDQAERDANNNERNHACYSVEVMGGLLRGRRAPMATIQTPSGGARATAQTCPDGISGPCRGTSIWTGRELMVNVILFTMATSVTPSFSLTHHCYSRFLCRVVVAPSSLVVGFLYRVSFRSFWSQRCPARLHHPRPPSQSTPDFFPPSTWPHLHRHHALLDIAPFGPSGARPR